MKIAVWHNLPSVGGNRALCGHVKGLVERGHTVESWCPPSVDQTYLPLSEWSREHQVVALIAKTLKVEADALRFSARKRMGDWRQVLLWGQSRIPWRRNMDIYSVARRVDPRLHWRLAVLARDSLKQRVRVAAPSASKNSKNNVVPEVESREQ